MDALERFVVEENISRYLERLGRSPDNPRCSQILRLLLAEGAKLAVPTDALGPFRELIGRCDRKIAEQAAVSRESGHNDFLKNLRAVRDGLLSLHAEMQAQLDAAKG